MQYERKYAGCRDQRWGFRTYAQHGDDLMIVNLFDLLGLKSYTWLDLGAHHPLDISNTALSYSMGNRGINVEANPILAQEFVRVRPRDTTLNIGVGLKEGTATFYMYGDRHGRNTFSEEEVKSLADRWRPHKTLQVPCYTVNHIVKKFCYGLWPDLLLTDIEGLDYDVLKSATFAVDNSPKIIVTEVRPGQTDKFNNLLESQGYAMLCRMGENLFFVRKDLWQRVF